MPDTRRRRIRRSLKHRRRTRRAQQQNKHNQSGGAIGSQTALLDTIRGMTAWQNATATTQFSEFRTDELTEGLMMPEAEREARRLNPDGSPSVDPVFAIPWRATEMSEAITEIDIRDLATILHAVFNNRIATVNDYKEWILSIDTDSREFLRNVEFSIRTYLKAPAATDKDPLYIWALAANGSGEPDAPLLGPAEPSTSPSAPVE